VFFSRQSFLMLGEEVKDDAGFEWWESRVHPDDLPHVKEKLENHMQSGATYDVQYRMRHANGTYLWWQSRGVAIRDGNGKATKMVGLNSNITELVEAKSEAETLSTHKSIVLRGVSGEVQPAASTITEIAAALYTTRLTKEQRNYLDGIKRATVQLNTFTEQIREYTEIEDTDTVRAAPEQIFCIEQTLDRVAARWAPIASEKGLSFRADNGCQGNFIGDVSKIESILDKLLSNAVKFTDAGEVGMACQEESPVAGLRQSLRIDITDTGRGMEESIQRRVFEPFVTAQNTQDGQPAGTGLGLATAHRLTSAIDGKLTISNRPDGGVAASLSVPVIPTVDRESDARTLVDQKSTGKLNVLVAEDDELNQFVIKTMMEYHGHSLTLAKNGVEVLDLWRRGAFDLVLMDIQMPVIDGKEATIELRRLEVEANRKRTPVIALTANALEHQVEEYLASGVDAFVAKPILEEELLEKISLVTRDARAAA
ncbi:MAG: response regulator, partial [Pseudomonadota bacterium]